MPRHHAEAYDLGGKVGHHADLSRSRLLNHLSRAYHTQAHPLLGEDRSRRRGAGEAEIDLQRKMHPRKRS
jgi:hypothetical protein